MNTVFNFMTIDRAHDFAEVLDLYHMGYREVDKTLTGMDLGYLRARGDREVKDHYVSTERRVSIACPVHNRTAGLPGQALDTVIEPTPPFLSTLFCSLHL